MLYIICNLGELAYVREGKYTTDEGNTVIVAVKTSKGNIMFL